MNCGGREKYDGIHRIPLPPSSCFLSFERNTARNGEGEERDGVMGEETLERARRRIL